MLQELHKVAARVRAKVRVLNPTKLLTLESIILKSVESNCFALLELTSTAHRTEAQLFTIKYISVKQSIFIKSCKPRQEWSKCSMSSERCTKRAARGRAKVSVLNLTTLLTLGSIILKFGKWGVDYWLAEDILKNHLWHSVKECLARQIT